MPTGVKLGTATVNAQADALARLMDDGYFRIYDGVKPTTANSPVTTQTLLAELRIASPSAPPAVNGVISLELLPDLDTAASGQASWYRILAADGATSLLDGTAGTDPTDDLVLNNPVIQIHNQFTITGYQHTVPK